MRFWLDCFIPFIVSVIIIIIIVVVVVLKTCIYVFLEIFKPFEIYFARMFFRYLLSIDPEVEIKLILFHISISNKGANATTIIG